MTYDAIIIGGSASGMMSAIWAAKRGKKVLLLEKNNVLGRKILATGNGRCNLTNRLTSIGHYHGGDKQIIKKVIEKFDQNCTVSFFEGLGLVLKEEDNGRIFPRTNQAASVVDALVAVLRELQVVARTSQEIILVERKNNWLVKTSRETFQGQKLVLATGGRAAHGFGSSGDGLFWARSMGHVITPIFASLVPLETIEETVKTVQGVKVEASVKALVKGKILAESNGDVLFTHYGLSGPAIMKLARWIAPFAGQETVSLSLDLYPEKTDKEANALLETIFRSNPKKQAKNLVSGIVPSSLAELIVAQASAVGTKKAANVSKSERLELVKRLKNMTFTVKRLRPLKEAQVTRGGVSLEEVTENLESNIIPNLFFAGEILDVDADSGGFNLQWAWSSGYTVGNSV